MLLEVKTEFLWVFSENLFWDLNLFEFSFKKEIPFTIRNYFRVIFNAIPLGIIY